MRTNILGIYEDEDVLLHAIDKIQEAGIKVKDVFSPIPLHHVWDRLKQTTLLPYTTFLYGATGAIGSFALLYWTSVISYPLKFGGKPLNTLSFIIIMFVLTILVGTVFTFLTFLVRQKLYPGKKSYMPDPRTVNDKFALLIEKTEDMDDNELKKIKSLLTETGASEVSESDVDYEA